MKRFFVLFAFPFFCIASERFSCLKDFENTQPSHQIEGIDGLFIINLDRRAEKYERVKKQFDKYGLYPCRFSAVDGSILNEDDYQKVGLIFRNGMKKIKATLNPSKKQIAPLKEEDQGRACFFEFVTAGAVGCYLSHVSILKKAYDMGLNMIWVFEDDVVFLKDPKEVTSAIERLSAIVNEEWDILHTDDQDWFACDHPNFVPRPDANVMLKKFLDKNNTSQTIDKKKIRELSDAEFLELNSFKQKISFYKHNIAGYSYPDIFQEFRRIYGRFAIHSMVIKRSGMKKILDFFETHGMFLPYDDEMLYVDSLKIYNLKQGITSFETMISDTGI